MRQRLVVVGLLFVASCSTNPESRRTEDVQGLEAQLDSIAMLFVTGKPMDALLGEYVEFFADDAVLLPPGDEPVFGRDAALVFYTAGFQGLELVRLEYGTPEILVDGDLAVRRYSGIGVATLGDAGDTLTLQNRYIDVLRRSPGGWRILWHTWSPSE